VGRSTEGKEAFVTLTQIPICHRIFIEERQPVIGGIGHAIPVCQIIYAFLNNRGKKDHMAKAPYVLQWHKCSETGRTESPRHCGMVGLS